MKKTLGGDRLGSGNKMTVDMRNYERSTHDPSFIWRTTMSAGTLVPFLSAIALPGDTFDIDLNCDVKTHPTLGPLFGSFKVQLDLFLCPIRLYNAMLHNNMLGIGLNMASVKLPLMRLAADYMGETPTDLDNAQINPSCILSYLGLRGVGQINTAATNKYRDFNAIPLLAYWDIYKNYYANKQEEIGAVIHSAVATIPNHVSSVQLDGSDLDGTQGYTAHAGSLIEVQNDGTYQDADTIQVIINGANVLLSQAATLVDGTGSPQVYSINSPYYGGIFTNWSYITSGSTPIAPTVRTFALSDIDDMRNAILQAPQNAPFYVTAAGITMYDFLFQSSGTQYARLQTQEGLGIKTYQSDLLNNWIQTDWIDGTGGIDDITSIDTSSGEFSITSLILARKIYDVLNRVAVSGGSYDDWTEAVYDHSPMRRAETPMYMGGLIKELVFQEVVSNSASITDQTQPLGTLAGKGTMGNKHKGGKSIIKIDEPSYIIGIISLTPRIDYSQGNQWDVNLKTVDDLHKPGLDEIGFQELITEQMAWWDTYQNADSTWTQKSAGKQPAWLNYMTDINRVRGNFAIETNEMFMTLNRKYQAATGSYPFYIQDVTTYIDPVRYNQIFAQTSIDAMNFWVQVAVGITARRKMSAKLMPNL